MDLVRQQFTTAGVAQCAAAIQVFCESASILDRAIVTDRKRTSKFLERERKRPPSSDVNPGQVLATAARRLARSDRAARATPASLNPGGASPSAVSAATRAR